MVVSFSKPIAFLAVCRLNNTLFASDCHARGHIVDHRTVQLDNVMTEYDQSVVDSVLKAYEGEYTIQSEGSWQ